MHPALRWQLRRMMGKRSSGYLSYIIMNAVADYPSPIQGIKDSPNSNSEKLYRDRWEGEVFHYTGEGTSGDQHIDKGQNKTLAQSVSNGVDVFLFEVR